MEIIALLVIGGIIMVSGIKSMFHAGSGKVTEASYTEYIGNAVRGRDAFAGPHKSFISSMMSCIGTFLLWILKRPYKIPYYFLAKKYKPAKAKFISTIIAVVVLTIIFLAIWSFVPTLY